MFFESGFLYVTVLTVLGTHYVDQAGLELAEPCLPLPSEYSDQRCAPPPPGAPVVLNGLLFFFFNFHRLYILLNSR